MVGSPSFSMLRTYVFASMPRRRESETRYGQSERASDGVVPLSRTHIPHGHGPRAMTLTCLFQGRPFQGLGLRVKGLGFRLAFSRGDPSRAHARMSLANPMFCW